MADPRPSPTAPRDLIDGIPDRAANRPAWKYALLAAGFLVWILIMLAMFLLGRPHQ